MLLSSNLPCMKAPQVPSQRKEDVEYGEDAIEDGALLASPLDDSRRRAEGKLLRKLDLRMSVLALMYILNVRRTVDISYRCLVQLTNSSPSMWTGTTSRVHGQRDSNRTFTWSEQNIRPRSRSCLLGQAHDLTPALHTH